VVRVGFGQHIDDRLFGGAVDVGNEVVMIILGNNNALEVEGGAVDDGCGAAGGFDRRIDHWVHVSFRKKTHGPPGRDKCGPGRLACEQE
jgi:hypothetical protein